MKISATDAIFLGQQFNFAFCQVRTETRNILIGKTTIGYLNKCVPQCYKVCRSKLYMPWQQRTMKANLCEFYLRFPIL